MSRPAGEPGGEAVEEEGFMDSGSKFLTYTAIAMLALILQVVLAVADQRDTPEKAAREFAMAYFWLDDSMAERLCRRLASGDDPAAPEYLQRVAREARELGYGFEYMKQDLFGVHLKTTMKDPASAEVTITGQRRRAINPVFGVIAKLFAVGETHPVEATLDLVKEGDRWKVCGRPFALLNG
jgi:hypothetical protein